MASIHRTYLLDLGTLLRERAVEARQKASQSSSDFDIGVAHGYYEVLSLLENQAVAFGLPTEELGLGDFVVDRELLIPGHARAPK